MIKAGEEPKIEEKIVDGVTSYHVEIAGKKKVFDNLLEAKMAIKTSKMGNEFNKYTGMDIFIEKD